MKNIIITMGFIALFAVIVDFVSAQTTKNIIEQKEFVELVHINKTKKEEATIEDIEVIKPIISSKQIPAWNITQVIENKETIIINPIDEDISIMKEKINKLEELKSLRNLEKNMKIMFSETDNLNLEFIQSLRWTSFEKLPMYIWEDEDFIIDSIVKDNVLFQYIEYFWNRYYKMDQNHRLIRQYIEESTWEIWEDSWMILWNLWCNFKNDCYRTWLFEWHYWNLYKHEIIPFEEWGNYLRKD